MTDSGRPDGGYLSQRHYRCSAIEKAVVGKLATLLLELAYIGGPQPKQYHRQQ
jgi:hypothetical protein